MDDADDLRSDPPRDVVACLDAPPAVRARITLTTVDYVDRFTITTHRAPAYSAEEWLRTALEATPTGRSAPALWRAIGLRLGPRPSPGHVQGWRILSKGSGWITVEASAWYVSAQAVCDVEATSVSMSLFLQNESPLARALWAPVAVLHRRAVPELLRQAVAVNEQRAVTNNQADGDRLQT